MILLAIGLSFGFGLGVLPVLGLWLQLRFEITVLGWRGMGLGALPVLALGLRVRLAITVLGWRGLFDNAELFVLRARRSRLSIR